MKSFFEPKSIAIVGAKDQNGSLGYLTLKNVLRGFEGRIFPVNPGYDEICGLPCFKSLLSIPGEVELAIVITPAPTVPSILQEAAQKGVKAVIIESAGFGETGPGGKVLEERIAALAKASGMRVWGPNCMGLVDVRRNHVFSFMSEAIYKAGILPGNVSLIVQSGMLSAGFLAELSTQSLVGISKACSIGNRVDVNECDVLAYLLKDPETHAIGLYLESFKDPKRFLKVSSEAKKPIVLLKAAKGPAGKRAALSHTASLSADHQLELGFMRQARVAIARDFQQMAQMANTLALIELDPSSRGVGVVTFSGGAGILTSDLLEEHGFRVPLLSDATIKTLSQLMPDWLEPSNPVDLFPAFGKVGPHKALSSACQALMDDPNIHIILLHYFAGLYGRFEELKEIRRLSEAASKPVVVWAIGLQEGLREFKVMCHELGIPVFSELSRAMECLEACLEYSKKRESVPGGAAIAQGPRIPPLSPPHSLP